MAAADILRNTRVSIKNQELFYKRDQHQTVVDKELEQSDEWCYVI